VVAELYFRRRTASMPSLTARTTTLSPSANQVANINREVWDLVHQNPKPLLTFLQSILVVALQFMIVRVLPHSLKNGLDIATVLGGVTLYKLPIYRCLIHPSLFVGVFGGTGVLASAYRVQFARDC
jgi:hypothetical protein